MENKLENELFFILFLPNGLMLPSCTTLSFDMGLLGKHVRGLNNKFSNIDMIQLGKILECNRVCTYMGMFAKNE